MTAWLLTWLWQGGALTVLVAIVTRSVPRRSAATTYLIWCATLIALVWLGWSPSQHAQLFSRADADPVYIPSAPKSFVIGFVGAWTAIALIGLLRVVPALRGIFMTRDRCRPFPSAIELQLPLWLEEKGRGRCAELMVCDSLQGAAVLGFYRPCIAIPSALIDALTCDELDQVILHEYAHVQRYDDWSRLGQTVLLAVLWIHPAAIVASRALNREREMACDDWVVARTGQPKSYARCLARAAEARLRVRGISMLEPALLGSRNELRRRVDRVLSRDTPRRRVSIRAVCGALCGIAACCVHLQSIGGFAEMAATVFPQVRNAVVFTNAPNVTAADDVFSLVNGPEYVAQRRATAATALNSAGAPSAPNQPNAPDEPDAPNEPGSISARTFTGTYSAPDTSQRETLTGSDRWQTLAAPGLEIASAAKKTSVGIASVFSRAGVSLARSF